jgi:hypothetical protein
MQFRFAIHDICMVRREKFKWSIRRVPRTDDEASSCASNMVSRSHDTVRGD